MPSAVLAMIDSVRLSVCLSVRRHTDLDSCRHQQGWPWMTLNVRFNLKCACRTVCWLIVSMRV